MSKFDIPRQNTQLHKLNSVSSCDSFKRCQVLLRAEGKQSAALKLVHIFNQSGPNFIISVNCNHAKVRPWWGGRGRPKNSNILPAVKHADSHWNWLMDFRTEKKSKKKQEYEPKGPCIMLCLARRCCFGIEVKQRGGRGGSFIIRTTLRGAL